MAALSKEIRNAINNVSNGEVFAGAEGWYLAKALFACEQDTKDKKGKSISVKFRLTDTDGADAGVFWQKFNIFKNGRKNEGAAKIFDSFRHMCGMKEEFEDTDQLKGLTCSVYIQEQNNENYPYIIQTYRPAELVASSLPPAAIRESRDISFAKNKEWADRFMPEIMYWIIDAKKPNQYIRLATEDEDKHRATDLVAFIEGKSPEYDPHVNIGVRTLDYDKFFEDCGGCFTLRDVPEPGTGLTEIDKAIKYVDLIVSSFAKKDDEKIRSCFTVSMWKIAEHVGDNADKLRSMGRPVTDRDGKTFYIFKMADFPDCLSSYNGEVHPDIAALDDEEEPDEKAV